MNKKSQIEKAKDFLSLHQSRELLILPNIWNPIGARILEAKGYSAVATASAAVSSSLGYKDGERIKFSTLMDVLTRVASSVEIPVSADIESGYADSISSLKENINQIIASGVVGINIEDSLKEEGVLRPIEDQCKRITAVRETAEEHNIHLVINARVDCFLSGTFQTNEEKIEETVIRAKLYSEAGADCIYPIGPGDKETVQTLRNRIASPINILASVNAVPLTVMKELGINRVSFGPYIFRSCLKKFIDIIDELYGLGNYDCFTDNMMSRDETKEFLIQEPE